MWRPQSFTEKEDSDQSISDGDNNYVSSPHNKDNVGLASRLELLKGFHQDLGFSSEDEVEVPNFDQRNLDIKNITCDPIISKTAVSSSDTDTWILDAKKGGKMLVKSITVVKESGRLDNLLTENARWPMVYSKVRTPGNGGKCKTKRRLSSKSEPHKQGVFRSVWKDMDPNLASDDELLEEAEDSEFRSVEKTSPVLLGDTDGETLKSSLDLSMKAVLQEDHHRHSMAELLDNLQGKIRNPHFKSKTVHRRRGQVQHSVIRSIFSSGKNIMSDEDPCELMHGESSTDSEDHVKKSEIAVIKSGRKTMADKFQEAFGCVSVDSKRPSFVLPKQSSTGLFGRLQNMMQGRKEQDAEFLKKVQTEVWPKDEAKCIDVKILSRSFEAKLSVCKCSLLENEESSVQNPQQEDFGKIWTVIFSARVCGDVDLEVGNLIRIFPPWKEVQVVRGGEIIILASYFSHIHS